MTVPTIIRSTDPGMPALTGEVGSAYTLFKTVLPTLGWTVEFDEPANYKIVFRNNPVTGSGCYVRIRDDGVTDHTSVAARGFNLEVFESMSDIDTGVGPHYTTINECLFVKSQTTNTTAREWVIIGDDRTVYFSIYFNNTTSNPPHAYSGGGFGDYDSFAPGMNGSFQTRGFNLNSNFIPYYPLFTVSHPQVTLSRNMTALDLIPTNFSITGAAPVTAATYAGIGGADQPVLGAHETRVYSFPAFVIAAAQGVAGKMRGITLPRNNCISDVFTEKTETDGYSSFNYFVIGGRTNSGGSGGTQHGTIFVNLGDWDVPI